MAKRKSKIPKRFKSTPISAEKTKSRKINLSTRETDVTDSLAKDFRDVDFKSDLEESYRELVKKILSSIKRKYSKVTPDKYFYNTKPDLKKKTPRIKLWIRVHDEQKGNSVLELTLKRKQITTRDDWEKLIRKSHKGYHSIHKIITQNLLPAINNKRGDEWKFISVVGWTGDNDNRQNRNTGKRMAGDKTTNKRRK